MLWKFIDRPREDSLTAAVFSHLLHLPDEQFWQILRGACSSSALPNEAGEVLAIHFWPPWSATGTMNSDRVIPDFVIELELFDLIIEAKRWDSPMQNEEQWKAQLKAYTTEYGSGKRPVRMIALGGNHSHKDEVLRETWISGAAAPPDTHEFLCPVHMVRWSSLLLECRRWKEKLEKVDRPTSRSRADVRILDDLINFFILHGFAPIRWFSDFEFQMNLLSESVDGEQQHFRNISRHYRLR